MDHDSGSLSDSDSDSDTQQEMDWKADEEFKKFMGNPSIEAAIKLEKKRADRKLKQLDRETTNSNPLLGLFNTLVRDNLLREKERLQKAEETFKALDLNQVTSSLTNSYPFHLLYSFSIVLCYATLPVHER